MNESAAASTQSSGGESVRTFLIADVRGYTNFTLQRGDEAAGRLARRFAEIAGDAISAHGGTLTELRGDEALAVFSSARAALRCAVELQARFAAESTPDLPLKVGIGLDSGEAVRVGDGFRGAALNLAARLCSVAGAGEVLASEGVTHLARRFEGVQYRDRESVRLKGYMEPVRVVEVVGTSTDTVDGTEEPGAEETGVQSLPAGGFLGSLSAAPLAGRKAEVERLQRAVEPVLQGEGRVVFLSGEPGIGKTRLAQELTRYVHERGFLVAAGRCYEPQESVAYYPFLEALSNLYLSTSAEVRREAGSRWPYLGQLLPDQIPIHPLATGNPDEQQRLFRAVTAFIEAAAEDKPLAVLLDDLHWADQSSLDLVQFLARHTRGSRVLVLGTYRDVEINRQHPLGRALRDLHREDLAEEIAVRRLDRRATAALIARTFDQADISEEFTELVFRHTEGNPFFTGEVLRALVERGDVYREGDRWERREIDEIEVPRSVRDAIGERLSHLSEMAQEILREAAVLGQSFAFDELQDVSGRTEDEVEEALAEASNASLIRLEEGDTYAFVHALVQTVLDGELSPRRRRRLHLRAGEVLEELPARKRDPRAAELAWHFLQADEPERALPYAIQAGDAATNVFAYAEAERHFRTALELLEDIDDSSRKAEIVTNLGAVLTQAGKHAESLEQLLQAAEMYRKAGDLTGEIELGRWYGYAYRGVGRSSEGIAKVKDLMARAEGTAGNATLAMLNITLEFLCFGVGLHEEALAAAERAASFARAAGDDALLLSAEVARGTELGMSGNMREAVTVLEEAVGMGETAQSLDVSFFRGLINLASHYSYLGRIRESGALAERALAFCESTGDPSGTVMCLSNVGATQAMMGKWPEAHQTLERGLAVSESLPGSWWATYPLLELSALLIQEGRWQQAIETAETARKLATENGDKQGIHYSHAILGEAYLRLERPSEALVYLEPLMGNEYGRDRTVLDILALVGSCYLALGQSTRAREVLDATVARAREAGIRGILPRALVARSDEGLQAGRLQEALADAEEAFSLAREQERPQLEAEALRQRGIVRARIDGSKAGREDLKRSLEIFERLGAEPFAEQARESLQAIEVQK